MIKFILLVVRALQLWSILRRPCRSACGVDGTLIAAQLSSLFVDWQLVNRVSLLPVLLYALQVQARVLWAWHVQP